MNACDVRSVESANLDIASLIEAIHLVQQLEQNPLDLAVSTSLCVKSFRRDGINLVNEDDSRRVFTRKSEHIAHHARSLSEVFLHEFRPNNANERSCSVMCDRFDEHGLPSTCDHQ
jgi:hypothetical protein